MLLPAHMFVYRIRAMLMKARGGVRAPVTGVTDGSEPPGRCSQCLLICVISPAPPRGVSISRNKCTWDFFLCYPKEKKSIT